VSRRAALVVVIACTLAGCAAPRLAPGAPREANRQPLPPFQEHEECFVMAKGDELRWRFTADGPLALLPLPEPHRCSLVWCDRPEVSGRRAALPADVLAGELQKAFGWSLGRITIESDATCWPMARRARRTLNSGREVWIGNAAQGLHPVAGQGLNLGLRDAFLLAQHLGDARARGDELARALPDYVRQRSADRGGTITLTDVLARAFAFTPLHPLQSVTLGMLDAAGPLRELVARRFMFGRR